MSDTQNPRAHIYLGLFFATLATLMLEILLTRVFSVILWYHYAFVAISIALFGMTLGAVIVHLAPRYFSGPALAGRLAGASALFGVTTAGAAAGLLTVRLAPPDSAQLSALIPAYVALAVPFTFSGIVVSVVLTRFPQRVNRLYAVDLIGAALGCAVVVGLLNVLDAPSALILIAALAALGGVSFGLGAGKWMTSAVVGALTIALIAGAFANQQTKTLHVRWLKGKPAPRPLYEKWNAFCRVAVYRWGEQPVGNFGVSYPLSVRVPQLWLEMDGFAPTVITRFDGDLRKLDYLPYDVSAAAQMIRPGSNVLVIGVGGGRDVLMSLVMKQKSITGIEINRAIIDAVDSRFGDFTGHLDRLPQVRLINDEGRSWVERSDRRFDIIVCVGVDTVAASPTNAFCLSESTLYTQQAWASILGHLTDKGILSMTRWYFDPTPVETLRLLSLARAGLAQLGVRDVRSHVAVVRCMRDIYGNPTREGMGTILISRSPLSAQDVAGLEQWARDKGFELVLAPGLCRKRILEYALSERGTADFIRSYGLDISPPTDDRPFFFNMLRLRDWASPRPFAAPGRYLTTNLQAVSTLGRLLILTIALSAVFVVGPLGLAQRRQGLMTRSLGANVVYFGAIGLGFMLVEISQMQRLIIFLGHPVYGLSVVLFALLGASGIGAVSLGSVGLHRDPRPWRIGAIMLALVALLAIFGAATPTIVEAARAWPTPARLLLATGLLVPIAFFMGAPFPLGMALASRIENSPTAWYWGINGAMSVVASVLGMALALSIGISATFFIGVACYAAAAIILVQLSRTG